MGKKVLITGIKRVGKAIAKSLIEEGYDLCLLYRSSEKEVRELERFGASLGRKVVPLRADLSDPSSYTSVVSRAYEELGGIDAFIHLASPYFSTPVEKLSRDDLYSHFVPIAEAFLFLSRLIYERMLGNNDKVKGRIVAFGDWAVECTPYKRYSAYFVAKGALHTAVKVLAKEFAPHVLVNCIALGPTLKAEELSDEEWERILKKTPLQRAVSLDDVISLTRFLLECDSITGEIIRVDGGRHIAGSGTGSVG